MTPLLDLVIDRQLKNQIIHHRLNAHWAASFFMEVVKLQSGAWPTDEITEAGHQVIRTPSVDEVIARAAAITEKSLALMVSQGWAVEAPPAEEIMDDGRKTGFVRTSD